MGRVTGRGIIITGAGSGIGEGFAKAFAKDGAKVGVFDLSQANTPLAPGKGAYTVTWLHIPALDGQTHDPRISQTDQKLWFCEYLALPPCSLDSSCR